MADQAETIELNSTQTDGFPIRSDLQCSDFLKLVQRNEVHSVKQVLRCDSNVATDARDELGRSAMVIAIDQNNNGMVQCLLESTIEPEDALFHAIATHNTPAIETICINLPLAKKEDVLNRFPRSDMWPLTTVPLLLAACQDNNTAVVQTLIHHGAKIPPLKVLMQRVSTDSYGKFLALLHWYDANSDTTYIMLTSNDPVQRIFELCQSLRKLDGALKVPRFQQECNNIETKLSALSMKMLDLTRNDKEVELLLNVRQHLPSQPSVPLRIQEALDIGFNEFVSHPSCQNYMVTQWQLSSTYHTHLIGSRIKSSLIYWFAMTFFFVPCIMYILIPTDKFRFTMKRPFVRFMLKLSSRLYFLVLLVLSTAEPMETDIVLHPVGGSDMETTRHNTQYLNYKSKPWDRLMLLIVLWIVGMTYETLQRMYKCGLKYYVTKHPWSVLEVTQLILYWIFIAMSIVASVEAMNDAMKLQRYFDNLDDQAQMDPSVLAALNRLDSAEENIGARNNSRYEWNQLEPILVAEAAFAVANVLTFLHLLHCLIVLKFLGPLLVSFSNMATDVFKFFVIFIFVWVSFAIGLTQLYRTFEALDYKICKKIENKSECPEYPFLTFWHSMASLFWSLFGPIDLVNLVADDDLPLTGIVGTFLYAGFMLMGVVVLLNALIAMMSSTYTRVEENSEVEWKVARTKLMSEYMTINVTLPPPFNIIPSVNSVLKFVLFVRQKCCRSDQVPLPQEQTLTDTTDAYKELSKKLVERCRRNLKMDEVTKMHNSEGQNEIDLLRKAVENISQEMKEMQQEIFQLSSTQ